MATSGAMADFARLPAQKKVGIFAGAAVLLGLLYFQFSYKPLDSALDDAQNNHAQLVGQSAKLGDVNTKDSEIWKFAQLRANLPALQKKVADNQGALPTEAELPEFFETLNRKAIEAGVDVRRWDYRSEVPVDVFIKAPVDIEISGTFMQIKRFFASLVQKDVGPPVGSTASGASTENRERIVSIDNLKLSNPTVINHEIVLTAKFTASTFRQEAPPPTAEQQAADAAANAAAAAAPATPTPAPAAGSGSAAAVPTGPIPSGMTPAGVKAKVEKSIEKGVARDNAAGGVDEAKTPPADRLKGGL